MIAPDGVRGRPATARFGDIDDIVVHQRGRVDHFHNGGHANRAIANFANQLRGKQHQNGPQALAAAILVVAASTLATDSRLISRSTRSRSFFTSSKISRAVNVWPSLPSPMGLLSLAGCPKRPPP